MINSIINLSQNLKKPCSFQWLDKNIEIIRNAPDKALRAMSYLSSAKDIRVYIDRLRAPEYETKIIHLPHFNDSWNSWLGSIKSIREIFIALNSVERWDEDIARWCANLFLRIGPTIDNQLLHLEVTYFIGNSHYTPFGVHIDESSDAIHYNLGPDDRSMYTWDREMYINYTGTTESYHEPEKILNYGQRNDITAGSGFFLPASKYYHIGVNNGFSVSLAIAIIRYDNYSLLERALRSKKAEYVHQILEKGNFIDEIIGMSCEKTGHMNFTNSKTDSFFFSEALTEYVLRVRSNGGFRVSPNPLNTIPDNWIDMSIRVVTPFKIFVIEDTQRMKLFARGFMLSCKKSIWLLNLIEQINSGELLSISSLIDCYRLQINSEVICYFLKYLISCRAIEVVEL